MGLRFCTSTSAADWIVQSDTPSTQLIHFGPTGFAAYARLRFIPDPVESDQAEADARISDDHPSDLWQARRAIQVLSGFTTTVQECYFCVWEGYSDIVLPAADPNTLVALPHRRYALLHGSLDDMGEWEATLGTDGPCPPPALAWPVDRSWFFAADVDPHWAGIGGGRDAIDALVNDPEIDVVAARPDEGQPAYR